MCMPTRARRSDIKATEDNKIEIFSILDYSRSKDLPCGDGVVFLTYTALVRTYVFWVSLSQEPPGALIECSA